MIKIFVVGASILAIFVAEIWHTFRQRPPRIFGHFLTNFVLWCINSLLNPALVFITIFLTDQFRISWRPEWLNSDFYSGYFFVCIIILDILIIDIFIYFWHRANHVAPFLWRFHQVHHSDVIMDFTTGLRFHFGEVVLSAAARVLIIIVFDIGIISVLVAETLLLVMSLFQHGNFRLPINVERLLSMFLVTPGLHWVHHHQIREDTDSNYANIFSFWDLLFRSRSPIRRFEGMPIGIEGEHKTGNVWRQISRPFDS